MLIVTKMKSGITQPNMPYLIRAKTAGDIIIIPVNNTTYAATNGQKVCQTNKATYTFTGLNQSVVANSTNNYYYMSNGSISHRTSGETTIKPNRWYMTVSNANNAKASFGIAVIDEDEATGISLNKEVQRLSPDVIHSVNGMRMNSSKNLPAGIYIKNNKKHIVK